jgi:cation:H+ antiporter
VVILLIAGLQFAGGAILVILAGVTLTKSADTLGKTLGLSAGWAGILILPLATSLPELVSSMRAVLIHAPDLAVGNLFGSNLFNLAILALVDLIQGKGSLFYRLKDGHVMTASLSLVLLAIAGLGLLVPLPVILSGWISLNTLLLIGCYLAASKLITSYEKRNLLSTIAESDSESTDPKKALFRFIAAAAVILVAGTYLTDASEVIALETGLGRTFVGSIFLAIATSLPEVVTTSTAARLGKLDMAVGNIFGANMYNMFILGIIDIAYFPGNLFKDSSFEHLLTILMCIALTSLVMVGLANRSIKAVGLIGYDSIIIAMGYLIAIAVLFYVRIG